MTNEEWRVVDLLDDKQPLVGDVKLAMQVVEVLSSLEETDLHVRIPKAAKEFAENTLSEWFEVMRKSKKRGNAPYVFASIYSPDMDGAGMEPRLKLMIGRLVEIRFYGSFISTSTNPLRCFQSWYSSVRSLQ